MKKSLIKKNPRKDYFVKRHSKSSSGKEYFVKKVRYSTFSFRKDYFVKKWNSSRNCQPPSRARQRCFNMLRRSKLCKQMFKTRFNEILDRFMETFVAPRMAAIEGGEVAEVKIIKGSNLHF